MESEEELESDGKEFDVLLEVDQSRRQLRVSCDSAFVTIERELGKLGKDISLLPVGGNVPDPECRTKIPYVIQRWCTKFKVFVDVTDESQFSDGDRLRVTSLSLGPDRPSSSSTSSSEVSWNISTYNHL